MNQEQQVEATTQPSELKDTSIRKVAIQVFFKSGRNIEFAVNTYKTLAEEKKLQIETYLDAFANNKLYIVGNIDSLDPGDSIMGANPKEIECINIVGAEIAKSLDDKKED